MTDDRVTVRPVRIQRRRVKGWRAPDCSCGCGNPAIYVGRPHSPWRNPYLGPGAVERFREAAQAPEVAAAIRRDLAGHDLMCWCPLEDSEGHRAPCHADVLLELANPGLAIP